MAVTSSSEIPSTIECAEPRERPDKMHRNRGGLMFRNGSVLSGLRISVLAGLFVITFFAAFSLSGCGGSSSPLSVAVTASVKTVDGTDTLILTATVANDQNSKGVTWSLSGGGKAVESVGHRGHLYSARSHQFSTDGDGNGNVGGRHEPVGNLYADDSGSTRDRLQLAFDRPVGRQFGGIGLFGDAYGYRRDPPIYMGA